MIFFSSRLSQFINFFNFKILYARENSPKLSLSAKTHGDSAIWVIREKLHISSKEEHLKLLQDSLKLFCGKWLFVKNKN